MSRHIELTVLLCCALVVSTFGIATAVPPPGLPGGSLPDTPASEHDSYVVEQGSNCVPVTPIQGNQTVTEFYDYRNPYTQPSDWSYSSFAPRSVTRENGSTMFLYESPDGVVSLVLLHDRLRKERTGDQLPMSAASFSFDGLPESGEWVVMDDTYDGRDDRWSRNQIDWTWTGSRVDGAVFRGLSGEFETTISPSWNENAALYDSRFATESVDSWSLLSGSASSPNETELDMESAVVVRPGTCGSSPEAALSASDSANVNERVTFDASGTTDPDNDLTEFRWDFDGDGNVDETTTKPTTNHVYESTGEKTVRVTAVDSEGSTDNATVTVSVTASATDTDTPNTADGDPDDRDGTTENRSNDLLDSDVLSQRPELGILALALVLLAGAIVARR